MCVLRYLRVNVNRAHTWAHIKISQAKVVVNIIQKTIWGTLTFKSTSHTQQYTDFVIVCVWATRAARARGQARGQAAGGELARDKGRALFAARPRHSSHTAHYGGIPAIRGTINNSSGLPKQSLIDLFSLLTPFAINHFAAEYFGDNFYFI